MKMNILVYSFKNNTLNSSTHQILKSILGANYDIIHIDSNSLFKEPWFDTTSCLIFLSSKNLLDQKEYIYNVQFEKKFKDYLNLGGNYLGIGLDAKQFLQQFLPSQLKEICTYKPLIINQSKQISSKNTITEIPLNLNRKYLLHHCSSIPNEIKISCDDSIGYFDNLENNNIISIATYNNFSTIIQYAIEKGKVILCGFDPFFNNIQIERNHFIRSLFSIFGLNLIQQNEVVIPELSYTLHLTS